MSKIRRSATIMMLTTLFSKFLGFARDMIIARYLGTSAINDAFTIAWQIPTVIFGGIGTALMTCYIPMYNAMRKIGRKEADRFNSNLINITFLLCSVLVVLFFLFGEYVVKITAWSFTDEKLALAVYLSRIMVLSVIFLGISNILQGYVQAHENFFAVGMMNVPSNLLIILGTILAAKYHIAFLAVGVLMGYVIYVPYFAIPAVRSGFRYRPYINLKDPAIAQILALIAPVFLGRMVFDINRMVDKSLATTLVEGSVSALNFAYRLNNFVTAIFVISITTVVFPRIVKLIDDGEMRSAKKTVHQGMNSISILVLPMTVLLMVLANPIVRFVFQGGKFDESSILLTAPALVFYSIGLAPMGYRLVMEKVFYALHDTKTPMINAVIAIVCNIGLNFLLVIPMKVAGIAFATSISSTVACFLFFFSLKKRVGKFGGRRFFISFVKISIACLVMGLSVWGLMIGPLAPLMAGGKSRLFIALAIEGASALVVYVLMLKLLRVKELNAVLRMMMRRREA